jgi:glyoxylase-like metal-dependent hydrolase (beta-lactamase superfamily II)
VLLQELGDVRPRALLLTHIHLDHAGASGSLVQRWPELGVYVHRRGARHMADPGRLVDSAAQLYGDEMDRLWGEMLPVPEQNLTVLEGGERLIDGRFEVAYTPGHASHHVSFLHEGTAFAGDVGGVRITPRSITIPPTPPPDVDVEAWHRSIELLRGWRPKRIAITHFGGSDDVDGQLDQLSERLDRWSEYAHDHGRDAFIEMVADEVSRDGSPEQRETYQQAAPVEQLYAGYERYWSKRAEREGARPNA